MPILKGEWVQVEDNYYNEYDPKAAAWLRELIKEGHIAPGDVDERSIEDVAPADLMGYTQCHFFAGIGVWSYALRRAGVPDTFRCWTGSCPCQPFSAAGKGAGFTDERHLWPALHHLLAQCKPDGFFGEQVASKDGLAWLDLVQADMEAAGYAGGALDLCAAGVGAPHIRQRLWLVFEKLGISHRAGRDARFSSTSTLGYGSSTLTGGGSILLADGVGQRRVGWGAGEESPEPREEQRPERLRDVGRVVDADHARSQGRSGVPECPPELTAGENRLVSQLAHTDGRHTCSEGIQRSREHGLLTEGGGLEQLAEPSVYGRGQVREDVSRSGSGSGTQGLEQRPMHGRYEFPSGRPGPTNGFWGDSDWIFCRDGKWRPVEGGTFPLAHGAAHRVGLLRGYGNAINAEAAQAVIEAYFESKALEG